MKKLLAALIFAAVATPALGQAWRDGAPLTGGGQTWTTAPATCKVGQLGFKSNATAGANIYGCTAANTWTVQGSSFSPTAPGPIGSVTPSTGAFTTLSASSTVSGAGFSAYLASPPAIGGSAAAAGTFTTLLASTSITNSALTSGRVVYSGASGIQTDSANLLYSESSSPSLQIGSGSSTLTGLLLGRTDIQGSGFPAIWTTGVTPSSTNYGVLFNATLTTVNAGSGTVSLRVANNPIVNVSSTGAAVVGTLTVSAIASSASAQTGYLCYNTSGGVITYDGSTTCLLSSARFKDNIFPLESGLDVITALHPARFNYKLTGEPHFDYDNPDRLREQPGLIAEDVYAADPRLATLDDEGKPLKVRDAAVMATIVKAIQELNAKVDAQRRAEK